MVELLIFGIISGSAATIAYLKSQYYVQEIPLHEDKFTLVSDSNDKMESRPREERMSYKMMIIRA